MLNVTIMDAVTGLPILCEVCSVPASSLWSDTLGKSHRSCHRHNPMHYAAVPLPMNFASHDLCHACGQPIHLGPQQVIYPGTAG